MDRQQRPASPADLDPERHFDERGVNPNPALDDLPHTGTATRSDKQPLDATTAYGMGGTMVVAPGVATADSLTESPTWSGQEADRPSNQRADGSTQDTAQTDATRGYAESDQRIFDVLGQHLPQQGFDTTDITVYVAQGVVTLTGTVDDPAEKQAVEDLARGIEGVQDIRNMLYVADGGDQPGTLPASGPHGLETSSQSQDDVPDEVRRMQAYTGQSEWSSSQPAASTADASISDMSGAIPEVTPVTAFTDEAGRTTGLKVAEGMEVVGADGKAVGRIKEVRVSDFLVSRTLAQNVYAPFECVQSIDGNQVTLMVNAGEVGDQGWAHP